MENDRTAANSFEHLGQRWCAFIYPSLKRVPLAERARVLRAARDTELDAAERFGVIASVGVAAYLLQSPIDGAGWLVGTLIQFALAVPLLAVLVAPWLIRRTRRGLQREADRLDGGDPCPESQAATQPTGRHADRARSR